ncbi:hypothetical protein [Clostridium sp.]|uniref:hypothetical protein n=1 Tax=Clostridium sp. TaxID=1506 RepID=UPI003F67FC26
MHKNRIKKILEGENMINLVLWTSVIGGAAVGATLVELRNKKVKKKEKERQKYSKKYKQIEGVDLKKVKEIVDKKTTEILKNERVSLREKENIRTIIYSKVTEELFKEI